MGLLIPCVSLAEDKAIDEILENSRAIRQQARDEAGEIPLPEDQGVDETNRHRMTGRPLPPETDTNHQNRTQQQRAWNTIMSGTEQGAPAIDGPERPPVPENVLYVYISLSMPEETIRGLFHQALAEKELRSTVFVLRGWHPPDLNGMVARLNKLFPEAKKLRDLPNVQIDPNLYEQQGIEHVPTFATKDKNGRWGTVVGSTSIVDAVARIESNRYDGKIIGPTFEIEEPNILAIIKERMANHDWSKDVERVKGFCSNEKDNGTTVADCNGG